MLALPPSIGTPRVSDSRHVKPKVKPVSLSADQVRNVARLARLGLHEDQIAEYAGELSNIVDVFAALERVNTEAVEPMAHPLDLTARLRADEPQADNQRDAFQAIAPATRDGVYLVPKVIE